jgi:hypothetical protein
MCTSATRVENFSEENESCRNYLQLQTVLPACCRLDRQWQCQLSNAALRQGHGDMQQNSMAPYSLRVFGPQLTDAKLLFVYNLLNNTMADVEH